MVPASKYVMQGQLLAAINKESLFVFVDKLIPTSLLALVCCVCVSIAAAARARAGVAPRQEGMRRVVEQRRGSPSERRRREATVRAPRAPTGPAWAWRFSKEGKL